MVIETEDRHCCGLEVCRSALEKGQRVLRRGRSLLLRLGVFIRLIHCQSHINGLEIRSFFFSHSNTYPATLAGCATGGGWRRRRPSLPLLLLLALRKGGFPTLDQDYFYGSSTSTTVALLLLPLPFPKMPASAEAVTFNSENHYLQCTRRWTTKIKELLFVSFLPAARSENYARCRCQILTRTKPLDVEERNGRDENCKLTEMATFNRTEGHSKAG